MEACHFDYLAVSKIIPFSERRASFCNFARKNGIKIEKANGKNYIRKNELKKAYEIYKSKPHDEINFFHEEKLIIKAFKDIEKNFKELK